MFEQLPMFQISPTSGTPDLEAQTARALVFAVWYRLPVFQSLPRARC